MISIFKTRQFSIFMKILFVFLLVFLPLYMFSMGVNIMGANNVKEEISKSVLYQAEYYMKNLEDEIGHIFQMQGIYMNDRDFMKLAFLSDSMSSAERIGFVENVRDKLNMIILSSKNIKEVSVYMAANDLTISASGSKGNISRNELSEMMTTGKFPFAYRKGQLFLYPSGSSVYKKEVLPMMSFSVELSLPQIEESLFGFIHYEKGGVVLFNKEQGWMITKSNNKEDEVRIKELMNRNLSEGPKGSIDTIEINREKFITVYKESSYLNSVLLVYIPESQLLKSIEIYRNWIWIISILAFCAIILFSYWTYRLIRKPLAKLLGAFSKVDDGVLDISIEHNSNDEFRNIYIRFNRMIEKFKMLINQMYEQRILAKNAELKQLQSQINSHFLYNCFFIVSRLIAMADNENAGRLTHHLALYYQFITRNSYDEIPLEKEISHAKNYMEIQSFRFTDRILYKFDDIPRGMSNLMVPRLILQPLIENCYNHGLKNKNSDGQLNVSIRNEDEYLNIIIEDNGDELEDQKLAELQSLTSLKSETTVEVTGLLNIHRRIQIKYGEKCGLFFSRSKLGGLCIQLKIFIGGDDNNVQAINC
jgi:two-component system, sensor histidine kinase YesM